MRRAPERPALTATARALAAGALMVLAACGGASMTTAGTGGAAGGMMAAGGADGDGGGTTASVTYYRDVLPITQKRCQACHVDSGIAPFPLQTYDQTMMHASEIAGIVAVREMPPWPPADGCGNFRDSRRLTDAEIATLGAWDKAGAPAGDPSQAPPAPGPAGPNLGTPGAMLDPGSDYHANATMTDDYHCFLIDPALAAQRDLIGFDIHPGVRAAVHHVLLYAIPADSVASAKMQDNQQAGVGWTCFGGVGVMGAQTVGGWVPGAGATAFPSPTGIRLAAGTQVVMQIHYNLVGQKDVTDRTTADLFFSNAPVAKPATIAAVGDLNFLVPAGTAQQTVTGQLAVKTTAALWGVVPHMHLHGTEIKVDVMHAGGATDCAVDIPQWDFNWQQFYYYQQPIPVAAGDVVRISCTFNNSPEYQPLINGVRQPPMDLRWGEKTTDEMCLSYLYAAIP
ncbi:MAG TPA: hypothetical protein VMU50_00800 [Polyangia bacterium]|nr:hypothetical protein [Polyangia bacterium]